MSEISHSLRSELRDPEYSEGYAESFLNSYIATQIKVIREQRDMTQSDLAREMGTTQTAVSRIENVNYPSWNITTLKKLARAFHVRLKVSFETFGTLPEEVERFNREALQRERREDDPGLSERKGPITEHFAEQIQGLEVAQSARGLSSWDDLLATWTSSGDAMKRESIDLTAPAASGAIQVEVKITDDRAPQRKIEPWERSIHLVPRKQDKLPTGRSRWNRLRPRGLAQRRNVLYAGRNS